MLRCAIFIATAIAAASALSAEVQLREIIKTGCDVAPEASGKTFPFGRIEGVGPLIWNAKHGRRRMNPGCNYYDADNVEEIDETAIRLAIVNRDGRIENAEIYTQTPVGYGTYSVTLDGPTAIPSNAVFGFFYYEETRADARGINEIREFDIEISKWNNLFNGNNAQFAAHYPVGTSNKLATARFAVELYGNIELIIDWAPGIVRYQAGETTASFATDVPVPQGNGRFRINLWLESGSIPDDAEVLIRDFRYKPYVDPS